MVCVLLMERPGFLPDGEGVGILGRGKQEEQANESMERSCCFSRPWQGRNSVHRGQRAQTGAWAARSFFPLPAFRRWTPVTANLIRSTFSVSASSA